MYVYRLEQGSWLVGLYLPMGGWRQEGEYDTAQEAARRVNYLNGGTGALYPNNSTKETHSYGMREERKGTWQV